MGLGSLGCLPFVIITSFKNLDLLIVLCYNTFEPIGRPLFGLPDHKGPKGKKASVNKRNKGGGLLMKKSANFIRKVTRALRITVTLRLPFINVTLAPLHLPQSHL